MILPWLQALHNKGSKILAVLFDPDDSSEDIAEVLESALLQGVELFFVGGSLVSKGRTEECVEQLKAGGARYVVLFPGNEIQVVDNADAILFMSLISGRNPEFLIGKQVIAAPWVKLAELETIPTGYMLVDGGRITSATYMSHTMPLPANKPDIAAATALAGEMLGLQVMYMDAGSGADEPIPTNLISSVRHTVRSVLICGGGIRSANAALKAWEAGADVVVIGNGAFEKPGLINEITTVLHKVNSPQLPV
jgi:phosphoglycerol geranylgeranyltransferase